MSCGGCNEKNSNTQATISDETVPFVRGPRSLFPRKNQEAFPTAASEHDTLRKRWDASRLHWSAASVYETAASGASPRMLDAVIWCICKVVKACCNVLSAAKSLRLEPRGKPSTSFPQGKPRRALLKI